MSSREQQIKILENSRIVVILGGTSREREVSLRTGQAIFRALQQKNLNVSMFDPKEQAWDEFLSQKYDRAFIALHGKMGEDGCLQGLLEQLKIPYTGSGVMSSAICFDKIQTKLALAEAKVLTPEHAVYETSQGQSIQEFVSTLRLNLPVVIKPHREGSSFGTTIVREASQLVPALTLSSEFSDRVLVERCIIGREVTVGVLNGKALQSVEIVPREGFYDYTNKYTAGKTDYYVPARVSQSVNDHLLRTSEKIVRELGCRGAPRVDYMVTESGESYFLEVNTIPGMTETSLLPKAAKACGLEFADLCLEILLTADLDCR